MSRDISKSRNRTDNASHPWYGGLEFRTLAESIPALVFVGDVDGKNIYSNAQFQRFTGLTPEALLGDGWLQTIHLDDQQRAEATWLKSWKEGKEYDTRYRFRRHDGNYLWHLVRGEPVFDGSGKIVRWIGSCTDVDELLGDTAIKSQSEQMLEALQNSPDIVVQARNASNEVIYSNATPSPKMRAKDGAPSAQAEMFVPDDALSKQEITTRPDRMQKNFRSTVAPLHLPDGTIGHVSISTDVSELTGLGGRHAELVTRYQKRLDTIPAITWEADESGKLSGFNQAWYDHTGLPQEIMQGFEDLIDGEAIFEFNEMWRACQQTGEILDFDVKVFDNITKSVLNKRAVAIPHCKGQRNQSPNYWYGTFI